MFTREKPKHQLLLEGEIENALAVLKGHATGSQDYVKMLGYVERLYEMLETPSSVSKDTLATIGANLLGIFMIIKHESVNVITSKAMSFVIRPK